MWSRKMTFSKEIVLSDFPDLCENTFTDLRSVWYMSVTLPPSYHCSPGSATPDTVHRGRRWRTPKSRRSAACCCTTCTPWPGWCSWRSWCVKSRASYRDEHSDSVDSLSSRTKRERQTINSELYWSQNKLWPSEFLQPHPPPALFLLRSFFLTGRFFTDEAVAGGRAGVGFETGHVGSLQVGAEARVAGLSGQPSQAGVGEGWHVLPAPVRHVDLPQAHPGRQRLQGRREEERNVRCSTCWLMTALQYIWFTFLSSCLRIHARILFLVPTNHNISPESVSLKLLRSRGEISWNKTLNSPFSSWELNKYQRPFWGQVSLREISNTTTSF